MKEILYKIEYKILDILITIIWVLVVVLEHILRFLMVRRYGEDEISTDDIEKGNESNSLPLGTDMELRNLKCAGCDYYTYEGECSYNHRYFECYYDELEDEFRRGM